VILGTGMNNLEVITTTSDEYATAFGTHKAHRSPHPRISIPFSDAIIATIALKLGIPIWTGDKHFLLIQSVLTGLNIYQTSEKL